MDIAALEPAVIRGRTILVVDDSEAVRTALEVLLCLEGARVECAATPAAALERLARGGIDLVIQDMNFSREATSGEEGVALFRAIRRLQPDLPVVLLTAWTHLETAVELVKAGAADYLAKPWDNDRLVTTARNLLQLRVAMLESRERAWERAESRAGLAARFDLRGIVYASDAMHAAVQMATQVARADIPVLITGPNGAGKEVIAEIIQANSSVRDGPFVRVNAGALPADLLESELFGAEAGAYTGAKARAGRFEAADGGTLFLDEIGNLPFAGQAKLLRVLQTGEFERLGSTQTRRVSVRVLSATNASLADAIREGRFREDLYYRLNVIEIRVPPLAERRDDVLPLAQHFLEPGFEFTPDAERALLRHGWPGNVRELANCVRRACLLADERTIRPGHLMLPAVSPEAMVRDPDRIEIELALARAGGVVARAARDLGLTRQSLYRRMERLGIASEEPRAS
ncbi:MAG TPA: sigma-54 dependent transcriptional regulator [Steroidobacteraceae bacterium]|nr:sigma-54 dependent transcriptional regulator [Steroidobacteraceae bacterium]HQR49092.1 sigma-54 dependent transcriptional regulator [Steroidobacteraceae bacterium]